MARDAAHPGVAANFAAPAIPGRLVLSLHALAAFVLASFAPALSLVLAPLLFGVPHVASDVRYLVLRRDLPRAWCTAVAVFAASMLALRSLQEARLLPALPLVIEHTLGSCWLLAGACWGAARSHSRLRSALVFAGIFGLSALAVARPELFRLGLAHAHNLVAVAIWAMLFRHDVRSAWLPIALIALATAVLASGIGLTFTLRYGVVSLFGLHLFEAADQLAPGVAGELALSLTLAFAFLQSIHYAIWLVAIPQDDARAEGSPSFRMKASALVRDFGHAGCWILAAGLALMAVSSVWAPVNTRNTYLSLASFHGWLELALLSFFLAQGRRVSVATASRTAHG